MKATNRMSTVMLIQYILMCTKYVTSFNKIKPQYSNTDEKYQ